MSQTLFRIGKAPFGSNKSEGEFLTDDIEEEEEEYDALNDETFGDGALDGDWEQDHEKMAGFIHGDGGPLFSQGDRRSKYFQDEPEDEYDEKLGRSKEIVEQTISHLGLEDDLDDPAVISRGRSGLPPRPLETLFGPSAPPPALIDAEECGSPKTQSIWSTNTPSMQTITTDNCFSSMLQNINVQPSTVPFQPNLHAVPNFATDAISSQKVPSVLSNIHKLEDIERDLLGKGRSNLQTTDWSSPPKTMLAEEVEKQLLAKSMFRDEFFSENLKKNTWMPPSSILTSSPLQQHERKDRWMSSTPPLPVSGNIRTLNDVENDILLRPRAHTLDEVERGLQDSIRAPGLPPPGFTNSSSMVIGGSLQPPIGTPPQSGAVFPMSSVNHHMRSSPVPITPVAGRSSPIVIPSPLGSQLSSSLPLMHPIRNLGPHNVFGQFNKSAIPLAVQGPRGGIGMPLMKHNLAPFGRGFNGQRKEQNLNMARYRDEDHFQGIMTHKEKEWLIKIQMLQLYTENPYVDDYYHTTHIMRKMSREKQQSLCEDDKDTEEDDQKIKLIVPERSKQEPKSYVPLQFEGSLGKLQVVSFNFPRRILDVDHMSTEEDSRMPANKELHKQRRLLLDIEKMYTIFLNIDDEEKRILALPEDAQATHRENRHNLIEKLFSLLYSSNAEEKFFQIASVRKGRHLVMRSIPLFRRDQQMTIYLALFANISFMMRRDQNDQVMPQYLSAFKKWLLPCTFEELVALGRSLQGEAASGETFRSISSTSREWNYYLSSLQTKFMFSCLCNIINKAEHIMKDESKPIRNDLLSHWTNFIVHVADALCLTKENVLKPPDSQPINILQHIRRFSIADDKMTILKAKLKPFGFD